jgi:RNA 2',3'-cyclic 3'-phosphodiesterase
VKPRTIRTFLAVEMAPPIQKAYGRLHESWRAKHRGLRWVRPENLHLTLRFFGSTPEDRLPALREKVERVARRGRPFRLTIGPPGCFGSKRSPRVVWLGIADGAGELASLARGFEEVAVELGFEPEGRPWSAHLTLARADGGGPAPGWEEDLASCGLTGLGEDVDHVSLLESQIRPGGAVYAPLWEARLGGGEG